MTKRSKQPIDRSTPPEPGSPRRFEFPAFRHQRLASGLQLYLSPTKSVPMLFVDLLTRGGASNESTESAGQATLCASLLDEGTTQQSAMEIANSVESLGGSLSTGADWDCGYLTIDLLAQDADIALDLLAELVISPEFPEEEIERIRRQRLAELARRKTDPASLAAKSLARAIFGDSEYGWPLIGRETSIERITRQDFVDFHERNYRPENSALIAVGDFDPEAFAARVEDSFARWQVSDGPGPDTGVISTPRGAGKVIIIDRAHAAQTELRLGHRGISRTDRDLAPTGVMNAILGGKFTSRLNLNLREEHGFTYGAHSRFAARRNEGPFVISTAIANDVVRDSIRECLHELNRIRNEPVEREELDDARDYLLGVFPYSIQTYDGLAHRLADLAIYSLPPDYYDQQLERIRNIDVPDVQRVAQERLRPEELVIVAVGPAEILEPQLREFGDVEIRDPETPS